MTCVVGVRTRKGVLLAGDQQLSWENGKRMGRDPKTIAISDVLAVACCGSPRVAQILQFHLDELEDPALGRDEQRWAVRELVPFLRGALEGAGVLTTGHDDNVETLGESAFLLAVRGRLFMVNEDFSVTEHQYGFDALGSGMETGIGAMHTAAGVATYEPYTEAKALKIAVAGLKAAGEYTNFVGGNMTIVTTQLYTDAERATARQIMGGRR